ncbi:hypothetical protein [Aquibacillus sediminis]|nr:hypothetical protein [Aquibacillus sediminis]
MESKELFKIIILLVIAVSLVFIGYQIKELIEVLKSISDNLGYINTNIQ